MQEFFKRVFSYNHKANMVILTALSQTDHTAAQISLFSHILNAHTIWVSRIRKETPISGVWEVLQIEEMEKKDKQNLSQTFSIIQNGKFSKQVKYKTFAGKEYSNSIQDILFHIINHSTHHRGQIIKQLRDQEIELPVTDFIFFAREDGL